MNFIILVLSLFMVVKTISYGIFEIKENHNKTGGFTIVVLAIFSAIFLNLRAIFLN